MAYCDELCSLQIASQLDTGLTLITFSLNFLK